MQGAPVDSELDLTHMERTDMQTIACGSGANSDLLDVIAPPTASPKNMESHPVAVVKLPPGSPPQPRSPTPSGALPPIRLTYVEEPVSQRPTDSRRMLNALTEVSSSPPAVAAVKPSRVAALGSQAKVTLHEAHRYQILRTLGEGAFGRVVAARDTKLGRVVALKLLHNEHAKNEEVRQRFLQEAHAAGCIGHPGIVTVFDVGEIEIEGTSTPFIAMELLGGESLQARIERTGPMSSARVQEIGAQVASALASAHRAGVIHRDLKPENLFVVPDRAAIGGERIKILDFGLAKPQLIAASVKTKAGSVFGTPAYMSPEQFVSTRDTDHRSDIYSFGCILFHLVAGRPPFEGAMYELITAHRSVAPPSLRSIVPDASAQLDALIQRMLAKDPAARPRSMTEIDDALCAVEKPEPEPDPEPKPEPTPARSRWSLRSLFRSGR